MSSLSRLLPSRLECPTVGWDLYSAGHWRESTFSYSMEALAESLSGRTITRYQSGTTLLSFLDQTKGLIHVTLLCQQNSGRATLKSSPVGAEPLLSVHITSPTKRRFLLPPSSQRKPHVEMSTPSAGCHGPFSS